MILLHINFVTRDYLAYCRINAANIRIRVAHPADKRIGWVPLEC